jgi:CRISPR system Cascade subunit CasA
MGTENQFNLIDELWIPVTGAGRISLKQLFSKAEYRSLGGNPIQKIVLTKLLLAIAQSASTPESDDDWMNLGPHGVAKACLDYLEKWHERFFLYGERPFLQIPEIKSASLQSLGAPLPEISTGNTTVLNQFQIKRNFSDADKAMLIVQSMGFALGGKKTDNKITLSPGYQGKTNEQGKPKKTGKTGPFVGGSGYLHSFLQGQSLHETLWMNLFTRQQISGLCTYPGGLGVAPWEQMPEGEDCPVARALKASLMGRLVPISRFCLLEKDKIHYSEGIAYPGHKEGGRDPNVAVDSSGKEPKALWTDPEKRPWRSLPALLDFAAQKNGKGFDCYQLRLNLDRSRSCVEFIGIWSGGLRVKSTSGEQYISLSGDFVESLITIESKIMGEDWFIHLNFEMEELVNLSKTLYGSVLNYFKNLRMKGDKHARRSSNLFWQLCERRSQDLIRLCGDPEQTKKLRHEFAEFVCKAYDASCPKETARQIDSWARNRPKTHWYTDSEKEKS